MTKKILSEIEKVKKFYSENPRNTTLNVIVFAPIKTGKTSLFKTARRPVYIDSFDPGGTNVLRKEIERGEVIVNTRWEDEDPFAPSAFRKWADDFKYKKSIGFFDHVGTYGLDSMTTWSQCIMNEVVKVAAQKKSTRLIGGTPQQNDWMQQMNHIENFMRMFVSLPCDSILTGHEDQPTKYDSEGNLIWEGDVGLMITGKLRNRVPALFDEIYKLEIDNYSTGSRRLVIAPRKKLQVGSRLASDGKLDKFEPADIKALLKKVGFPSGDKYKSFNDIPNEEEGKDAKS